jgi:hypothetical protein
MDVPNTEFYMFLGYGVLFLIMLGYIASLWIRNRNLSQDEKMLEELEKKD